ncbi:oncostatin-M-specific receptor subunit beta isoform X2 [Xenopus laevis]|uniref:Oncostatin-M-specific receptor subunit beta isoform X2 n=1 Tax=Xenopus laevis TaxID=8355 RepID=A0A8J1M5D8_XENLA|nr:oncostatin-M-specific receptor subunit beta isoform X2 [Xenopus laevis]
MDWLIRYHQELKCLLIVLMLGILHCQGVKVSFAPLNLEMFNDSYQQRLSVRWSVSENAYLSGSDIIFHAQVGRDTQMNIIRNETYISKYSDAENQFTWFWDSDVPLECYTHFVRIRGAPAGDELPEWSPWSQWKAHYGKENLRAKPYIFPHEKIVQEGTSVNFCCIPGKNQKVAKFFWKTWYDAPANSNGTFDFTVHNVSSTKAGGANVICTTTNGIHITMRGTVLFVTKPPDEPTNMSCETQDLKTLICSWNPGKKSNLDEDLAPNYKLHEWFSKKTKLCSRSECTWPIQKNQNIYNFTLVAKNQLGMKSVSILVDATQRVHPLAPTGLELQYINATNAKFRWTLKADYTGLLLLCQTELQMNNHHVEWRNITVMGKAPTSFYTIALDRLQPYTNYTMTLRCMAATHLSTWSDWSEQLELRTHEDVPTAQLDIWREVKSSENGRTVTLYWRPFSEIYATGYIVFYNVTWRRLYDQTKYQSRVVHPPQNTTQLSIDRQAYVIHITAQNGAGISPPSEIRIPNDDEIRDNGQIKEGRVNGKDGGIYVSWKPHPANYHGYVVEWCNFPKSQHCDLQWKKFNSSVASDVIKSGAFNPGVRYTFRIFGSNEEGEHFLEKKSGYIQELACSMRMRITIDGIQADMLHLTWDPYQRYTCQEGFITHYRIYLKSPEGNCQMKGSTELPLTDGKSVCMISINDTEKKSFSINPLKPNTKYEIAMAASTGGGESPLEFTKVTTQPDTAVIIAIALPVIIVSIMLLQLLLLGYWKRQWVKNMCYPDIPDPNKSNVLSFPTLKEHEEKVMVPRNCVVQKIEIVNQQKVEEVEEVQLSQAQSKEIEKLSCRSEENDCANVSSSLDDMNSAGLLYQTFDDPINRTQPSIYLEFFNRNYCGTPEDAFEILTSQGYQPQREIQPTVMPK